MQQVYTVVEAKDNKTLVHYSGQPPLQMAVGDSFSFIGKQSEYDGLYRVRSVCHFYKESPLMDTLETVYVIEKVKA